MGFIFLLFIISLQFTATFSVPGANFVKELHKFYMGSRFSFNPCSGIQHELLDDFYVEFFRQNLDNELELASKIAVYTLLYMSRWKANQNILKLKNIYFLPNNDEQQMQAETKDLFVNICSALGEVHSAALWQRKAAEQTMSGVEFYTSLTANPNQYSVVKPSCKDMEECFESVRNNSEEILEWVLSDLMHFFLKRKKLVKFFDEVKKRDDKNEHRVIWFKFARLLGVPRMAMIYITHEENLDFLFSAFSRNSFYTHLYQSFFEDTTKLGKWRAKMVLDKFLYDEWFKEKFDNEFLFIAIWEDENDNADLNALRTNLVDALNDCWLAYSKSFWYDDKKIRAKIDDFAKKKIEQRKREATKTVSSD
uniref:Uncharacterized protein n=1 Tax=Globodera rostochiensis TaxID=31243 RepID=A0A914H2R4_GLORO